MACLLVASKDATTITIQYHNSEVEPRMHARMHEPVWTNQLYLQKRTTNKPQEKLGGCMYVLCMYLETQGGHAGQKAWHVYTYMYHFRNPRPPNRCTSYVFIYVPVPLRCGNPSVIIMILRWKIKIDFETQNYTTHQLRNMTPTEKTHNSLKVVDRV